VSEAWSARLAAACRAAVEKQPGWQVSEDAFVAHVAARLPEGSELSFVDDLLLAFACSLGDPRALAQLEAVLAAAIATAVARVQPATNDFADEVRQRLRERLLVGEQAKIREYAGNGPIRNWARAVAVRTALNLVRSARSQSAAETRAAAESDAQIPHPELSSLARRHLAAVEAALRTAMARLDRRDRFLLRLHYVERVSLQQIGISHNVDRSTASRWVAAARTALLDEAKRELAQLLALTPESIDSLISGVESQLQITLSGLQTK
jgi:RNA polymerase sigma-70 factor (ECF subfamily)